MGKSKPLTVVLTSKKDRDIYLLNMTESAMIALSFFFPTRKKDNSYSILTIAQNGKSLWNMTVTALSRAFSTLMRSPRERAISTSSLMDGHLLCTAS